MRAYKFVPGERCQLKPAHQLVGIGRSQHSEQVDDLAVELIVDFSVRAGLSQQHRSRAAERLYVDAMLREVADYPRRQPPLAAMPTQYGATRAHSLPRFSASAMAWAIRRLGT